MIKMTFAPRLAHGGFKHHTGIGVGRMKAVLEEAFTTYLHYDMVDVGGGR
ncbi:MAG: hypothetical protein LBF77_06500 [Spirochaetaceae bacterium]|jgi:hypothetical protein|nr:hypothetical protein [Spirochaetaceae bacterium]